MTRFFALLLMTVSAVVIALFLAPEATAPEIPYLGLGIPLLVIGGLFGLLAAEHHFLWSFVATIATCTALYFKGASAPAAVPDRFLPLAIPPVALLIGSVLGSLALGRKHRELSEPETTD